MPNPTNKITFTPEMHQFLKDNYKTMTNRQLANALGLNLTRTRTELYSLGLKRMELQYWTKEQIVFLKENYKTIGDTELAELFTAKWYKEKGWSKKHIEKKRRYLKLKRSPEEIKAVRQRNSQQNRYTTIVDSWKHRRKLHQKTVIKRRKTTFNRVEDEFLKNNYLKFPVSQLCKIINRSSTGVTNRLQILGLEIPREVREERKRKTMFKKGQVPYTKGKKQTEYMSLEGIERTKPTRFKKGDRPASYKTGEHQTKDGYIMKSLGEGKKQLKHIYVWEQANKQKLSKNQCLTFLDGDRTNCDINNLKLISRQELMLRNSKHDFPSEIIPTMTLISQINNKIKTLQNGTE